MRLPARLTVIAGRVTVAVLAGGLLAGTLAAASPLTTTASSTGPEGLQAKAAAVANATTGNVLWSRGLNTERPIASITKVMTALVVIRAGDLNRQIKIPAAVVGYERKYDASSAGLHAGDVLTARELLEALLLPSGADAAYALADAYGPGLTGFIARMNATAASLGMTRTHFANFDGLAWPTEYSTYSTPADLITLGRAAMRWGVFRSVAGTSSYRLAAGSRHRAYLWRTTDRLLGSYPGADGIKTGFTKGAGYSLLFEARRGGRTRIGVVLDSSASNQETSFADAARMLDWGFARG
jgi:D-alanyl-D-alanine carboxypeptidase (penicillin-binding protein 5/6)